MHLPTWSEDRQANNIAFSSDFFIYLSYLLEGITYSKVVSSYLIILENISINTAPTCEFDSYLLVLQVDNKS